ncbi:hypothetical protein [Pseudomarimonas arenosa]|uniref:Uncharacterized protein n=1 Tax=Pseudomarimonas arenosa TaxID=2774145 RepID=A0AAW3ZCK3_9GAMM|nr:hypothetical protein [Pseudomarimonas arenosa]MBD8524145.1 hypothetical protein [Pseudomarimonas arenosa]
MRLLGFAALCVSLVVPALSHGASDDGEQHFAEMLSLTKAPKTAGSMEPKYGDCENHDEDKLLEHVEGTVSQYIYNDFYEWAFIEVDGQVCVLMIEPITRLLDANEVRLLGAASKQEFPIPKSYQQPVILERPPPDEV